MSPQELFLENGSLHVKNMLSQEMCHYLTHLLMVCKDRGIGAKGDEQVPNAVAVVEHEYAFETVQEILWPYIENAVGEELLPTYSYARLYQNGNTLERHVDRPACEISVTIQLGRSHHYSWPIYMGSTRYDLAEGDGVIYSGTKIPHWRDECRGPEGYYSGQVFVHFVRKNGPYADQAGDSTKRQEQQIIFVKNRTLLMEDK